jgi:hypothetical protein
MGNLQQLGRNATPSTTVILQRGLACPSHIARDGAVIGLSDLRDTATIAPLKLAAASEKYRLLGANMLGLVQQLEALQS